MERVPGPDFPTGGVIVEPRASLLEAYETGRGGVRLRARWEKEERGARRLPDRRHRDSLRVKKGPLVEQLADLLEAKKAPLLGDVRDKSTEDVRLVLEPQVPHRRARGADGEPVPSSATWRPASRSTSTCWTRRATPARAGPEGRACKPSSTTAARWTAAARAWRLGKIADRLHILEGLLIVFLNLDEVIRIVRYEEEPKAKLIETFSLTDIQANAILDTRLRQLAKLEEMELRREHETLTAEQADLQDLLASEKRQWAKVGEDLRGDREGPGQPTPMSSRAAPSSPTRPSSTPPPPLEAAVPREPITVILSERGWIRAAKGAVADPSRAEVQGGRQARLPRPGRDHRQAACCSPRTAAPSRSAATPCPTPAARASRCG